jgi:hypothetical protein
MMRKPSRVPTSCKPLEVVRNRRSTGIAASNGAGQRHPNRVQAAPATDCRNG